MWEALRSSGCYVGKASEVSAPLGILAPTCGPGLDTVATLDAFWIPLKGAYRCKAPEKDVTFDPHILTGKRRLAASVERMICVMFKICWDLQRTSALSGFSGQVRSPHFPHQVDHWLAMFPTQSNPGVRAWILLRNPFPNRRFLSTWWLLLGPRLFCRRDA